MTDLLIILTVVIIGPALGTIIWTKISAKYFMGSIPDYPEPMPPCPRYAMTDRCPTCGQLWPKADAESPDVDAETPLIILGQGDSQRDFYGRDLDVLG